MPRFDAHDICAKTRLSDDITPSAPRKKRERLRCRLTQRQSRPVLPSSHHFIRHARHRRYCREGSAVVDTSPAVRRLRPLPRRRFCQFAGGSEGIASSAVILMLQA
jgi:hypothetical protein